MCFRQLPPVIGLKTTVSKDSAKSSLHSSPNRNMKSKVVSTILPTKGGSNNQSPEFRLCQSPRKSAWESLVNNHLLYLIGRCINSLLNKHLFGT